MTIAIRSGIERLIVGVREYLEADGTTAVVDFGRRALASQLNQGPGRANRIVFVPYDPKSGAAGRLLDPSQVGPRDIMSGDDPTVRVGTTRALADWERALIVSVWAYDGSAPENELAQEVALEQLVEVTLRAVYSVGFASIAWSTASATLQGERKFGRENRFALQLTHPLYDKPNDVGYPGFAITKTMKSDED